MGGASRSPDEEDESSVIKCVCGYQDDDGNTVLCEECNSWQHIECYYPNTEVPDVHECVDCDPRPLDATAAAERQRNLRDERATEKKQKRSQQKTAKKKPSTGRDSSGGTGSQPSSTSTKQNGHDRKHSTGSPMVDTQPAPKKPKTAGNRTPSSSTPVSGPLPAGQKRRSLPGTGSRTVANPALILKNASQDYYAPDFMALHRQPEFRPVDVNTYTDLQVANSLHNWLIDPDALSEVTNGLARETVYATIDGFDTLEQQAPRLVRGRHEDKTVTVHGEHPVIQWIATETPVMENAFIGELKGQIGRKQDYIEGAESRWPTLHHPEPFMFFPPYLPIYIDSRVEGNSLRYIRRSCNPNLKMQILIDDATYHFCFVSTRPIEAGEEITIAWDINENAREILEKSVTNGNARKEGIHGADDEYLSHWVTAILSNFGGCACSKANGGLCWLERFDRRGQPGLRDGSSAMPLKVPSPSSSVVRSKRSKKSHSGDSLPGSRTDNGSAIYSGGPNSKDGSADPPDSSSVSGSLKGRDGSRGASPTFSSHADSRLINGEEDSTARQLRKLRETERYFQINGHVVRRHGSGNRPRVKSGSSSGKVSSRVSKQSRLSSYNQARPKPKFVDAVVQTDSSVEIKSSPYRPLSKEERSTLPLQTPRWRLLNFWRGHDVGSLISEKRPEKVEGEQPEPDETAGVAEVKGALSPARPTTGEDDRASETQGAEKRESPAREQPSHEDDGDVTMADADEAGGDEMAVDVDNVSDGRELESVVVRQSDEVIADRGNEDDEVDRTVLADDGDAATEDGGGGGKVAEPETGEAGAEEPEKGPVDKARCEGDEARRDPVQETTGPIGAKDELAEVGGPPIVSIEGSREPAEAVSDKMVVDSPVVLPEPASHRPEPVNSADADRERHSKPLPDQVPVAAEKVAEQSLETTTEKAFEKGSEQSSAEKPAEKPAENTTEKPAETTSNAETRSVEPMKPEQPATAPTFTNTIITTTTTTATTIDPPPASSRKASTDEAKSTAAAPIKKKKLTLSDYTSRKKKHDAISAASSNLGSQAAEGVSQAVAGEPSSADVLAAAKTNAELAATERENPADSTRPTEALGPSVDAYAALAKEREGGPSGERATDDSPRAEKGS